MLTGSAKVNIRQRFFEHYEKSGEVLKIDIFKTL